MKNLNLKDSHPEPISYFANVMFFIFECSFSCMDTMLYTLFKGNWLSEGERTGKEHINNRTISTAVVLLGLASVRVFVEEFLYSRSINQLL